VSIELLIAEPKWRKIRGLSMRLEQAATLALKRSGRARAALTILLADDRKLRALNSAFRGKKSPTNVLSFPMPGKSYLGDVAIAYGVTEREARAQKKPFADHATHLVVHGVLHLLGYDHATERQARVMEPLESAILARLGIADPYAAKAA